MQTKIKILMTLEKAHVIMLSENIKKRQPYIYKMRLILKAAKTH